MFINSLIKFLKISYKYSEKNLKHKIEILFIKTEIFKTNNNNGNKVLLIIF